MRRRASSASIALLRAGLDARSRRTIWSPRRACTTPHRRSSRGSNAASPAGDPGRPARRCRRMDRVAPDCGLGRARSTASRARDRASHVRQEAAEALGRSRDARGSDGADRARRDRCRMTTRGARRSRRWAHGRSSRRATRWRRSRGRTPAWTSSARPWKRSATSRTSAASCC